MACFATNCYKNIQAVKGGCLVWLCFCTSPVCHTNVSYKNYSHKVHDTGKKRIKRNNSYKYKNSHGDKPYLPLSLPTPQTRIVWMGWVLRTVRFSGSISFSAPSSRSMNNSLPWGKISTKTILRNYNHKAKNCHHIKCDWATFTDME